MEDSDLISDDPERLLAEQARARRYAILVEGLAITGGIAAVILAFWVSTMKPVRTTGFYVAIGASVGTALVLVGVLLRIQRAITRIAQYWMKTFGT
jgi:archaellum biogenesis protein FlaJ (TadC family)